MQIFVVLAPVAQRAGGDSWQLWYACCGPVGCPSLRRNAFFPPCVDTLNPSKCDLPPVFPAGLGRLVRYLPLPPRAHGPVAVALPRDSSCGVPGAVPSMASSCWPCPSPKSARDRPLHRAGLWGVHLLCVAGCAAGSGRAFRAGSPARGEGGR